MSTLRGLSLRPHRVSTVCYESLEQGRAVGRVPEGHARADHRPHDMRQEPSFTASPNQQWVQLPMRGAKGKELGHRGRSPLRWLWSEWGKEVGVNAGPLGNPLPHSEVSSTH